MNGYCKIEREIQRHERELSALYEISCLLNTHFGQREMLQEVLRIIEETLDMQRCAVLLRNLDMDSLVVEATSDESAEQKNISYRRGEGIIGQVLETGQPEVVPCIEKDNRFVGRIYGRDLRQGSGRSFICVPITMENEVVGTLSVDLPYEGEQPLYESQRLLSIVAGLLAYDVRMRALTKLTRNKMEAENLRLRHALGERLRPENIIGNSDAMRMVYERIHLVAGSDTTVLIRGESGTGKELVASAIHYNSSRASRPLIRVNCAALNEALIESELFGHERGAFTGAVRSRVGRIEEAEGGTLFLDEIGDFSPMIQVKLLRVLQEREYERVGGNTRYKADVRIVAATNRDLEQAIQAETFRHDLYYRINVFSIYLPPLRERKSDILQLADAFAQQYGIRNGKHIHRISTEAINALLAYHWPGNVRELENCIEHAALLTDDGVIHANDLPPSLQLPDASEPPTIGTLKKRTQILERDMIIDALKRYEGNLNDVSRELGITARMVRYKMSRLGIVSLRQVKDKTDKPSSGK